MDKNLGLGKGLSALMGDDFNESSIPTENNGITLVDINLLTPSPYQPRRVFSENALMDLVRSIQEKGVLQPLLVRPKKNGEYEIIAGERRLRASKQAGLSQVPVIIKDFDDKAALEVALIENLQREDLNPLEEAEAYARLLNEFNYTQDELSKVVGKSRSHVANMMRLLDLPSDIKQLVENKELTIGHARALLNAQNPSELAAEIIDRGLSVRQTEKIATAKGGVKQRIKKEKINQKDSDILALEKEMSNLLKTPVEINWTGKNGTVVISYENLDMLDVILQKLTALGTLQ
ncbi:MAG: ParB/RepB/Spo0J family partition protein [Alphaproteobacteria bacterium]|nr:ParB/RepB/Spo0J family partition protein [Alphaproteobacteria bacterium]